MPERAPDARRARRWAVALLAATLTAASVAAASAHHGEPATGNGVAGESDPGEIGASTSTGVSTDTELTPVGKPGEQAGWQMIAGSKWRADGDITQMASPNPGEPSPTPYDLDFYGVDFFDKSNGFAVGAQCKRSDPAQLVAPEDVAGCDRIPVIYRYYEHPTKGLIWEESYRASDSDDPGGFIAAVTWLGPDRALAVGGTGTYPRRERERDPAIDDSPTGDAAYAEADEDPNKGAGMARAWLFESGSWQEITDIPAEMRALHAIDTSPRPSDCGADVTIECAIAGGMRQLWHFADGQFGEGFGPELNGSAGLDDPDGAFRFRVRDIRFFSDRGLTSQGPVQFEPAEIYAAALTAGCCSAVLGDDRPAVLYLDAQGWHAVTPSADDEFNAEEIPPDPEDVQSIPPSIDSPGTIASKGLSAALKAGEEATGVSERARAEATDAVGDSRRLNPDSYYALGVSRIRLPTGSLNYRYFVSAVRTPGGPPARYEPREPASRFTRRGALPGGPACDNEECAATQTLTPSETTGVGHAPAPGTTLSSLRLVSADGDVSNYCTAFEENQGGNKPGCNPTPDGVPDWAVGVIRSSGKAVAYTTTTRSGRLEEPLAGASGTYLAKPSSCSEPEEQLVPGIGTSPVPGALGKAGLCDPEAYQRQNASKALYELPSYALNAYRVAGEDLAGGDPGTGWAVGDHGAILTRGGGVAAAERPPDRKGAKPASEPVGRGPFDQYRPDVTGEPGTVPGLTPGTQPAEPGFYESQIPGRNISASKIVISRDGSEGWLLARDTFLRYDGARWSSCDAQGVEGVLPADRGCAALASVREFNALARVPLERDSDPTNDDEFEAVALTDQGLYRYREGRWSLDDKSITGRSIAFTAPSDGWVVTGDFGVFHYDGEGWVECRSDPAACGDPGELLNITPPCDGSASLTVAGERVYFMATRDVRPRANVNVCALSTPWQPEPYPMIIYHDRGDSWRGGEDSDLSDGYDPTDGGWDPGRYFAPAEEGERTVDIPKTGSPTIDNRSEVDTAEQAIDQTVKGGGGNEGAPYRGRVRSLAVAQNTDGSYQGWAVGTFGGTEPETADAVMMRLSDGDDVPGTDDVGTERWRPWRADDAANDYLRISTSVDPDQQLTLPSEAGRRSAFLLGSFATAGGTPQNPPLVPALAFDQGRGRWEAIATPWSAHKTKTFDYPAGAVQSIAPDGRGGFWAGVQTRTASPQTFSLHHYTDRAPSEVLTETANPTRDAAITAMAGARDGSLWLGDESGSVYRYDRLAGWSRAIRIPGWDARVTTNPAGVNAIAVGPDGEGVAVGPGGRIANLGSDVSLDPAATVGCDPQHVVPPCGTGNDLRSAAVAPDGSALVAGRNRTLLWRPAGGDFRPVEAPQVPLATAITKLSMPRPDRAYLLTHGSEVFAGTMSGPGQWSWERELGDPDTGGDPLTATPFAESKFARISDIAIDAAGRGYAVGADGLLLHRTGEGDRPWRRFASGYALTEQSQGRALAFYAVGLPSGGGEGALIGGEYGLVLTVSGGRLQIVRHPNPFDPVGGNVGELALIPGYRAGDVEAWAAIESGPGRPQSLLHYGSDSEDPRLNPARALAALPDVPAPAPGELSFAAFGKQDCFGQRSQLNSQEFLEAFAVKNTCGAADGSNLTNDFINRRIREELAERSRVGAPQFAVFTGDAVDTPGGRETLNHPSATDHLASIAAEKTPLDIDLKHARWVELVAQPLEDGALPVLGAIGGQDLTHNLESCQGTSTDVLFGGCIAPRQAGAEQISARPGANLPWRAAMARVRAPWEGEQEAGGLRFEPLGAGVLSQEGPDAATPQVVSPRGRDIHPALGTAEDEVFWDPLQARAESYRLNAGDTHYATDVIDTETDERLARIVVVDTSMRSLAASDPQQHPIEAGGQARWLEEMLCFDGSPEDTDGDVRDCTREEGQRAIVVSNTPTYSYGPISPEETATDAALFESIVLKNEVDVVVSGGVGWNGRYWTLAPGLHAPCPEQPYRPDAEAPAAGRAEVCGQGTPGETPSADELAHGLPEEAREAAGLTGRGAIPFVVSSTAGGNFNTRAERSGFATADAGFWRGYSIVRLHPSGDPAKTIVEQRPILDWVGIEAQEQVLEARARIDIRGYAREAFGNDRPARYYDIPDHEGITHRYHLLLVHPDEPWRVCEAGDSECEAIYSKLSEGPRSLDSAGASSTGSARDDKCSPYLCLPERIGTINPITGEVSAGNGKYPDTFAMATLSVGDHVAAQPLVFKRSPAFIVNPALGFPEVPGAPTETGTAQTPPPPPPPPTPNVPQVNTPAPPLPPPIAPLQAAQPPEPQPPAPPAPPPPTEQPSPLSLTLAPPSIAIATPTAVIQPPTPPVNPAPPGGARREARQRQAAAQKSGADSDEATSEGESHQGDHTRASAGDLGMSRRDRTRPAPSFTALARADQPSAWAQGALYSGGIALVAFALAAGFSRGRPTPRSRPPEVPAPAWNRAQNPR